MTPITYEFNTARALGTTTSFADYVTCKPHICCGWMPIHKDEPPTYKLRTQKTWSIKPISWHVNACFVHRVDGKYKLVYFRKDEIITFEFRKQHGVLPEWLAILVVDKNSCSVPGYGWWKKRVEGMANKPKLVWDWAHE